MKSVAKIVELPSTGTTGSTEAGLGQAGLKREETGVRDRPLRPAQCRAYMRRTLAREFPGIVSGFVEQARQGSCQHVKLATELLDTQAKRRTAPRKSKTLSQLVTKIQQLED